MNVLCFKDSKPSVQWYLDVKQKRKSMRRRMCKRNWSKKCHRWYGLALWLIVDGKVIKTSMLTILIRHLFHSLRHWKTMIKQLSNCNQTMLILPKRSLDGLQIWLKTWTKNYGFRSPNSPDLNPIEHVWLHFKRKLHTRNPGTLMLQGSSETVKAVLC